MEERGRAGTATTRLLSQLAARSQECEAPGRGGSEGGGAGGGMHVELITYLQLLVGHGDQSVHVVGEEVRGAHVHVIRSRMVGPH